jgi:uncharacterized repeat protein (TIGR02543 family)
VLTGGSYTLRANAFTKSGHEFVGWNTAEDGSGTGFADVEVIDKVEDNIILYAQWLDTSPPEPVFVTSISVTGVDGATSITIGHGTLQMAAYVLPLDAYDRTVVWSVSNASIASIDADTGMLTAVSVGIVTVRATARDGSGVYGEAVITVSEQTKHEQTFEDILDNDDVEIDDLDGTKTLVGIETGAGITISDLLDMFDEGALPVGWSIVVHSISGLDITGEDNLSVGTGQYIVIYSDQGDIVDIIVIVIMGDVTGTGVTDIGDARAVINHILATFGDSQLDELEGVFFMAANMTGGGTLHVGDVRALINIILESLS